VLAIIYMSLLKLTITLHHKGIINY